MRRTLNCGGNEPAEYDLFDQQSSLVVNQTSNESRFESNFLIMHGREPDYLGDLFDERPENLIKSRPQAAVSDAH
jgi:hypothetical protein